MDALNHNQTEDVIDTSKKVKVGIQIYSFKDAMEKDMDATFKAVKEIDYDYVEFA